MKTILEVLGESSVRAIIIAFTTACVLREMRVQSPGIRHRAWTGVLIAMLCLPFLSIWAPRIAIPILPASSIPAAQEPPGLAAERLQAAAPNIPARDVLPLPKPSLQSRVTSQTASRVNIYQIAGILYLAGFCVLALRLLAATLLSRRLARGASREGKILYSQRCTVPVTVGLFRARIYLPAESRDWDPDKLEAVLTHEKEHMRRRDPLVEWIALVNRSLYWFNPLAWWLCGKLSALAEHACDEAVLARGHDSGVYAEHLLEFARSVKQRGSLVTLWGSSLRGSTLAQRVRRILNSGVSPAISPARLVLLAVLWTAPALVALFSELSPVHAAPPTAAAVAYPPPIAPQAPAEMPAREARPAQSTASTTRSVLPSDKTLYETGKEYFQQRQFLKARLAFQTLINSYPDSSLAASAYIAIADSYYEEGGAANLRQAEEQYKNFVVFFPRDPRAGDAYMKIISKNVEAMRSGSVLYRGNALRARAVIETFISSNPNSDYRPIAQKMLDDLNRELANQRLSNITGYVVNKAGKPIRGVSISAFEKTVTGLSPVPVGSASSDEQGHFTLSDMPLDNQMEIHLAGESLAPFVYDGPDLFSSPLRITMRELWIERIDIKGNRRVPEETIRFYIKTRQGDPYSRARLNFDVQALYQSNFFDNVEVEERDGESGKIITFTVDEKSLIRSIQYVGNRSLTESEILEAYSKNKVGLIVDSQFEYRKVRMAERILKELLAGRGKPRASIRVETETLPPSSIRLRFIIDEDGN